MDMPNLNVEIPSLPQLMVKGKTPEASVAFGNVGGGFLVATYG